MQIKGRDYQVLYTKESKEVQVAIDLLSMVEHKSLTVEYKERKAFLTPFIPLLINPQKEHGLKGVIQRLRHAACRGRTGRAFAHSPHPADGSGLYLAQGCA